MSSTAKVIFTNKTPYDFKTTVEFEKWMDARASSLNEVKVNSWGGSVEKKVKAKTAHHGEFSLHVHMKGKCIGRIVVDSVKDPNASKNLTWKKYKECPDKLKVKLRGQRSYNGDADLRAIFFTVEQKSEDIHSENKEQDFSWELINKIENNTDSPITRELKEEVGISKITSKNKIVEVSTDSSLGLEYGFSKIKNVTASFSLGTRNITETFDSETITYHKTISDTYTVKPNETVSIWQKTTEFGGLPLKLKHIKATNGDDILVISKEDKGTLSIHAELWVDLFK